MVEETFIYECKHCGTIAQTPNPIFKCSACEKSNEEEKVLNPYEIFGIKGQVEHFYKLQPFFYDKVKTFHLWIEDEGKWESCDKVDMLNMLQKNIPHIDTINSKIRTEILTALEQVGRKKETRRYSKDMDSI